MDRWIKLQKRANACAVYQHKQNYVRYLHAVDVRNHLGCCLGVTVQYVSVGPVQM